MLLAAELHNSKISICKGRCGVFDEWRLNTTEKIGNAYRYLGELELKLDNHISGKIKYDKVTAVYLKQYGENHTNVANVRNELGNIEFGLWNYGAAKFVQLTVSYKSMHSEIGMTFSA